MADEREQTELTWLADWIRKVTSKRGETARLARLCGVKSQMISLLKSPSKYDTPPGLELMWRLMAAYHDVEEFASFDDATIRAILFRLIASLGPSRLHYLSRLSSSEAQAMIEEHERKAAERRRFTDEFEPPPPPSKKS